MARKIKVTPVLTGKDAARFEKIIKANETESIKVPRENYEKALDTYNRIALKNA